MNKYCKENDRNTLRLTPEFLKALMEYNWPGNVRELENVIERAVVLSRNDLIDERLIPENISSPQDHNFASMKIPAEGLVFKDEVSKYEALLIKKAMEISGNVQKKAAELLGLKPSTLNEMIKRLNKYLDF